MRLPQVRFVSCSSRSFGIIFALVMAVPPSLADDRPLREENGPAGELIVRAAEIEIARKPGGFMGIIAIDPQTAKRRTLYTGSESGPLSPDGRYMVSNRMGPSLTEAEVGIWIYDLKGNEITRRIFERRGEPFWSPDGRQAIIGTLVSAKSAGALIVDGRFETWRVNADGTGRTKLPIPETDLVLDCSRDWAWLATRTYGGEPGHWGRLTLVHPDGTDPRYLTEGSVKRDRFSIFRISPDSRYVAYVEVKTEDDVRKCQLFTVDIEGKHRRQLPVAFNPGTTVTVCWSPDGSRLALNLIDDKTVECSLAVVDFDGKNYRELPLPRWNIVLYDWK